MTGVLDLKEFLPANMKHIQHSKLFQSLEGSLSQFYGNKIVSAKFVAKLVDVLVSEFEKAFDRQPVSSRILEVSPNSAIVNYRFDRGYWEIVLPSTSVMITDKASGTTTFFRESVDVSFEGSGGGLRKGKRKSESIKRAHSRQVAKDTRYVKEAESDEDEEYSDGDWEP